MKKTTKKDLPEIRYSFDETMRRVVQVKPERAGVKKPTRKKR